MATNKSKAALIGKVELITGLCLWAIVGGIVFTTSDMPVMEADNTPGPRFLPILVAGALTLLTALYWMEAYCHRGKAIIFPDIRKLGKPAAFFAIAFLVVLLWDVIGAVPVVLLVSFLEFKLLEKYSWKHSLVAAGCLCVFTYVLFEIVLDIMLPRGIF